MLKDLIVLLAEDEEVTRENLQEALSLFVKEVFVAKDGKEAYELYLEKKPDIILTDVEMPHITGIKLTQKIRQEDKTTPIIILTAYTNTEYLLKAIELNLVKYLIKPVSATSLRDVLQKACDSIAKEEECPIKKIDEESYYDFKQRSLYYEGVEQKLTSFQRVFLEYMLKASNRLVDYAELESGIWKDEVMTSDALRSVVKGLRQKLPPDTIVNFSKLGYKLVTI